MACVNAASTRCLQREFRLLLAVGLPIHDLGDSRVFRVDLPSPCTRPGGFPTQPPSEFPRVQVTAAHGPRSSPRPSRTVASPIPTASATVSLRRKTAITNQTAATLIRLFASAVYMEASANGVGAVRPMGGGPDSTYRRDAAQDRLPPEHTGEVIHDVFANIDRDPALHREYDELCSQYRTPGLPGPGNVTRPSRPG